MQAYDKIWGAIIYMRMTVKCLSVFLSVLFVFVAFQFPSLAQFESAAGSALLMEASTGKILYEKEADVSKPPASITKLMTLLLAFEAIEKDRHSGKTLFRSRKRLGAGRIRMFLEVDTKVPYRKS